MTDRPKKTTTVLEVSLTEQRQFRRLVEFAREVEAHAQAADDYELLSIVNHLDDDLLQMLKEAE